MTVLQWVNRVRRKVKLNPVTALTDDGGHWSIAEMLDVLNDVSTKLCEETMCLRGTSTASAVADQREYDYDSDWVEIKGILFDSVPLQPFSIRQLDFMETYNGLTSPHRDETDSTPSGFYIDETTGKYGLIPAPSASGTDNITILHTVNPDEFTTASTATTELLNSHGHLKAFHSALVFYGIAELEAEDGDPAKAAFFEKKADIMVNKLKRKIKYPAVGFPEMMNMQGNMSATKRFWTD